MLKNTGVQKLLDCQTYNMQSKTLSTKEKKNCTRNCFKNICNSKVGLANTPFLENTILTLTYSQPKSSH